MLSFLKREKSKQLEDQLNAAQAQRRTGWENLPEDELFTPAGFSEEQAEATASSNYSYWGSTFRAFFKNKFAVALLIALVVVVAFAFIQPHLPGQADPNLCAVDPVTGIQYRNIAPGQDGFIWGSNSIGQDLWARICRCTHQSDYRLLRGPHRSCGGHYRRCAVGLCARAGLCVHRAVQHLR